MFGSIMMDWTFGNTYCSFIVTLKFHYDPLISILLTTSESRCLQKFHWPKTETRLLHHFSPQQVVSCLAMSLDYPVQMSNIQMWNVCQWKIQPNQYHCINICSLMWFCESKIPFQEIHLDVSTPEWQHPYIFLLDYSWTGLWCLQQIQCLVLCEIYILACPLAFDIFICQLLDYLFSSQFLYFGP